MIKHRSTSGRFVLKSSVPCEFKLAECLLDCIKGVADWGAK
jgi:hypothetical protein